MLRKKSLDSGLLKTHFEKNVFLCVALLGLFFSGMSFAKEDSLAVQDSLANAVIDSLQIAETVPELQIDSVNANDDTLSAESILANFSTVAIEDTVEKKEEPVKQAPQTVLYLDGSKNSAWFVLGALYAFEAYGVKVDSIVGTSYGAWLGTLWKSGFSLDDIQRIFRHPDVAPYLSGYVHEQKKDLLPVADAGVPALKTRLTFSIDSLGNLNTRNLPLHVDTSKMSSQKYRLRVEETLLRKPVSSKVAVVACDGSVKNGAEAILRTMPFDGNLYGVGCETPFPREGDNNEILIVSAVPIRAPVFDNAENEKEYLSLAREFSLYKESAIIIRPFNYPANNPEAWMQSGFSETEKKLAELASFQKLEPYTTLSDSIKPWFRLVAVPDSVPSEKQSHLLSFWNENDTGFVAIENFLDGISKSIAYDSLDLRMQGNGNVLIKASAPLQLEASAGGFGNSIFGAFAFGDARIHYVNQFEYELGASVFYGMGGFGAMPELKLLRMLESDFDFGIRYEFSQLRPLKSYLNDIYFADRIYEERKGDLTFSFVYHLNELQKLTLSALVGSRKYELHQRVSSRDVKVTPLSPMLELEHSTSKYDKWFGRDGFAAYGAVGMESVGASFGYGESVPIFWKFKGDVSGNISPLNHLSLGGGAVAGANYYREGKDDVPPSFGYYPVDMTIRQGIEATPWTSCWYSNDFRSHRYALLRANAGLHLGVFSAWLFAAYVRDFENSFMSDFSENRFVVEPALRFAYKSITLYAGMSKTVDDGSLGDLKKLDSYKYFIQVGNFTF